MSTVEYLLSHNGQNHAVSRKMHGTGTHHGEQSKSDSAKQLSHVFSRMWGWWGWGGQEGRRETSREEEKDARGRRRGVLCGVSVIRGCDVHV